jgi:hypothetical protein
MVFTFSDWYNTRGHHSEIAGDWTMKQIEEEYSKDPDKRFDEKLAIIYYKYRVILDASYHLLLSGSNDLEELIQFAPGFLVIRHMPVPVIAWLLDVDETSFLDLLERNRHFVNFFELRGPAPGVMLNRHLREFLSDRNRSIGHYHDPTPHHLAICLKHYKSIFDHPWSDMESK